MGYDVTHPSPNSSIWAPSVAAGTAFVGPGQGQYVAASRVQKRGQEMTDIGDMFKELLPFWKTVGKHARFPEFLLLWRDGVDDGQHQMVVDHELRLLKKACEEMYGHVGQEPPRITMTIVSKRHHTRLGPTTTETADDNGNCLAGTVTDRGITEAGRWDFFLRKSALHSSSRFLNYKMYSHISTEAHSAIQGAARPAHYIVVHDEIFRSTRPAPGYTAADTLEDVTQSLHYTFGRCSRAVSLCTPTYYAHLACERSRLYLSSLFDPSTHSDTASMMSDLDQEDDDRRIAQLQELITPHPRVRDTMYYI